MRAWKGGSFEPERIALRLRVFAAASLLALAACPGAPSPLRAPRTAWPYSLVAHAGGAVAGLPYTNSREALEGSWTRGFRLFEVDFDWTADGKVVLVHDWGPTISRVWRAPEGRRTLDGFHALRVTGGLTPLDVEGLEAWVSDHPGARIVSDVKERNVETLRLVAARYPSLARRLIPQIYGFEEYEPVRSMGYLSIILTLYLSDATDDEVVAFARTHELLAVTMTPARARTGRFVERLAAAGVPVYAHTVNDRGRAEALLTRGVHGIYTDDLAPADLLSTGGHIPGK